MTDPNAKEIAAAIINTLRAERMSLDRALKLIAKGEKMSRSLNIPMVFTVVDDGGNMVAMHRMDDALLASITVSYSKAYTAAALRTATEDAAQTILPGQPFYGLQNTHPGQFCLFGGGVPVYQNGRFIGGLGVSGGTARQDSEVAHYAVS